MDSAISLRDEVLSDGAAIGELTEAAFRTLEVSKHTEQFIIEALRASNALAVSLVAEQEGQLLGHIAFSPITLSDGSPGWYGLGPVSVRPERQRQGVGSALIRAGLARLKQSGAAGCCLVGHPDYYPRFGFRNTDSLTLEGLPPELFFALSFDGRFPRARVGFHDAFLASGPAGKTG